MLNVIWKKQSRRQVVRSGKKSGPPLERLERRCLLSVSASTLAGPVAVAGNTWTYADASSDGSGVTDTLTSKGLVSHNGQQMIEVDLVLSSPGFPNATGVNYYGFTSQGYLFYEGKLVGSTGTITDTINTPPEVELPDTLTANVPVTGPVSTETETVTQADGTIITSTDTVTITNTLVSETPSVTILAAGKTFTCYEVDSTQTTTDTMGVDSSDVSKLFIDPSIGLVQITDVTNNTVSKLTNFIGKSFHLEATPVTNSVVGDTLSPLKVSIVDSNAVLDTKADDAVTITASISPASSGTGTLLGTTTATTVDGVATFTGLSINKPGQYTLKFTDSIGRTVSTNSFQVTAGKLVIKRAIRNGVVGTALKPAIEVDLVNNKGKVITDSPSLVTLNITGANSSNPITGNTAQLVNGIALFSGVKLGVPDDYILTATDNNADTSAISNQFEVTGVHLAFQKQPQKVGVNVPLKYIIEVKDFRNRLVNTSSIGLGFTLDNSQGSPTAVLSNSADTVDFGIANNSDRTAPISINAAGTYTITAKVISQTSDAFDYTIDPITSNPFLIVANHLQFIKQPRNTIPGIALRYEVVIKDFQKHIVTNNSDQLQFTLIPSPGSPGAALSGGVDSLLAGHATNALNLLSIDTPGAYKLSVVDVPAVPGDPVADGVSSITFKIKLPK